MTLRGIRGATCLAANDAAEMRDAVRELLGAIIERNGLVTDENDAPGITLLSQCRGEITARLPCTDDDRNSVQNWDSGR